MADTRLKGVWKEHRPLIRQKWEIEPNQRNRHILLTWLIYHDYRFDIENQLKRGLSSFIEHQTYHQS